MSEIEITKAEFLILSYVEKFFTPMQWLNWSDLALAVNMPPHELGRAELIELLHCLFESRYLIAKTKERGYFKPTLDEIERALDELHRESPDFNRNTQTYYGMTSAATKRYRTLKVLHKQTDCAAA